MISDVAIAMRLIRSHALDLPPLPFAAARRFRARAVAPDDARPFVVGSGGHYPRVVAANARGARRGHSRGPARLRRAGARAGTRAARSRRRRRSPRARATRHNGADVHADGVPRAARCDRRGHRRQPAPVRRPAAARGAAGRRRARAGLRGAPGHRAHAGCRAAAGARRPHAAGRRSRATARALWRPIPLDAGRSR